MSEITIAKDFSRYPIGRYRRHGPESGEAFRDDLLIPRLKDDGKVFVILDGTTGYPSSFLEEAFGGLVRAGYTRKALEDSLVIVANDPDYVVYKEDAWQFIFEAEDKRISA